MDSIDKFGRHLTKSKIRKSVAPYSSLQTTDTGHYDFKNKRLSNIHLPIEPDDCTNKRYVDLKLKELAQQPKVTHGTSFGAEIGKLQIQISKVKDTSNYTEQRVSRVETIIADLQKLSNTITGKVDNLTVWKKRCRLDLDVVEVKLTQVEATTKRLLSKLEEKIESIIKTLNSRDE